MTLHLKSRGYPFRPRLLFSSFIVVGVGFPTVYYFRRGHSLSSVETVDFCKSLPWTILIFLELWGVDLRTGYRYFQAMANKMSVLTVLSQHAHDWL